MTFNTLPIEMASLCLSFIPPNQRLPLSRVCKLWKKAIAQLPFPSGLAFCSGSHSITPLPPPSSPIIRLIAHKNFLIGGTKSGTIEVYDIEKNTHLHTLSRHKEPMLHLFCEGNLLVSVTTRSIAFWDLEKWSHKFSYATSGINPHSILLHGSLYLTSTNHLVSFEIDAVSITEKRTAQNIIHHTIYSTLQVAGEKLIHTDGWDVSVWDAQTLALISHSSIEQRINTGTTKDFCYARITAMATHRECIFTGYVGSQKGPFKYGNSTLLIEWDIATLQQKGLYKVETTWMNRHVPNVVSLQLFDNWVVTVMDNVSVYVWSRKNRCLVKTISEPTSLWSYVWSRPKVETALIQDSTLVITFSNGSVEKWSFKNESAH